MVDPVLLPGEVYSQLLYLADIQEQAIVYGVGVVSVYLCTESAAGDLGHIL